MDPNRTLEEAFGSILECDRLLGGDDLRHDDESLWPLLRGELWSALTKPRGATGPGEPAQRARGVERLRGSLGRGARRPVVRRWLGKADVVLASRPVFTRQSSGPAPTDRLMAPIADLFRTRTPPLCARICYLGGGSGGLAVPGPVLEPSRPMGALAGAEQLRMLADEFANYVGLDGPALRRSVDISLERFWQWRDFGAELFASSSAQALLVGGWYFPDAMGLIAAARRRGLVTVDVQHGKVGRLHGMYAGWTGLGSRELTTMPEVFWCWGTPSEAHMTAWSPSRAHHRPVVGGYPHLGRQTAATGSVPGRVRLLVTMQPPQATNLERFPDFLLEVMNLLPDLEVIVRAHPNDPDAVDYCHSRFAQVPPGRLRLSPLSTDVHDELAACTHHATAYSSTCFEAAALGIPTLLWGQEAASLYDEEIDRGRFTWTDGSPAEVIRWLADAPSPPESLSLYIETDPAVARGAIEEILALT